MRGWKGEHLSSGHLSQWPTTGVPAHAGAEIHSSATHPLSATRPSLTLLVEDQQKLTSSTDEQRIYDPLPSGAQHKR